MSRWNTYKLLCRVNHSKKKARLFHTWPNRHKNVRWWKKVDCTCQLVTAVMFNGNITPPSTGQRRRLRQTLSRTRLTASLGPKPSTQALCFPQLISMPSTQRHGAQPSTPWCLGRTLRPKPSTRNLLSMLARALHPDCRCPALLRRWPSTLLHNEARSGRSLRRKSPSCFAQVILLPSTQRHGAQPSTPWCLGRTLRPKPSTRTLLSMLARALHPACRCPALLRRWPSTLLHNGAWSGRSLRRKSPPCFAQVILLPSTQRLGAQPSTPRCLGRTLRPNPSTRNLLSMLARALQPACWCPALLRRWPSTLLCNEARSGRSLRRKSPSCFAQVILLPSTQPRVRLVEKIQQVYWFEGDLLKYDFYWNKPIKPVGLKPTGSVV